MKKLLLSVALLLCPLFGLAQATSGFHRVSQVLARAPQGGVTANIVPNAKVAVTSTSTGLAATIYSDPLLTAQIIPALITADFSGSYSYYIPLNYCVTETITAPGQKTQTIPNICQISSGLSVPVSIANGGTGQDNSAAAAVAIVNGNPIAPSGIIDTSISSGTSTICPNGAGGAFTTVGCVGGGDSITSPNSTLNVGGTSSATTIDINLGHANTWTAAQTFSLVVNSLIGYEVNGSSLATGNLADWTNSGIANGDFPIWNSGTSKWTPSLVPLTSLATQSNDTVVMNATAGTASPTPVAMPVCTGSTNADIYDTTAHAWSCNSISGGGGGTAVEINGGAALGTANFLNNSGAGEIDFTNPSGSTVNATLHNTTISGISLGNNLDTLTFGTHLAAGGSSYNGSANVTITSDATNANTASTIVARDGSGNFSAGTITATLNGNATSATTATTATNFSGSLSGDVTGTQNATFVVKINGGSMPGSANVLGSNSGSQPVAATAAQIVAQIGSTAVTNATNATTSTNLAGGAANDIPYQTGAGATSFISPVNNAVLVTSAGGAPSESTTLPGSLTIPSPTFSGTVAGSNTIPLTILSQIAGNSLLGNATGSTANVAPISMPSCSTTTDALYWTSGSGIGCHAISVGTVSLNSITAATGANTIANGNNYGQIWNWALTSSSQTAFTFGETTAATGTSDELLAATTLAGSTAVPLTIANSLTGSQTLPALQILPTWNTTGVVDAALLVNVTNTASGTAFLLEDLKIGGTSEFKVDKVGNVTANGAYTGAGTGLTGTASSLTAGSVANSLTMNNSGSGASSGATFNGSSSQTISYNTIGAAPALGNNVGETSGWTLGTNTVYRFTGSGASNATTPASFSAGFIASIQNAGTASVTVVTGGPTLHCEPSSCVVQQGASAVITSDANGTDFDEIASNANGSAFGTLANTVPGTGVATALAVNTGTAGAFGVVIANGTAALNTAAVASGACETVVTVSASGVATTDVVRASFNGDPTAVTGYGASATGAVLTIYPYPTSGNVNFKVCNSTANSITPGSLTLNWQVLR